MNNRNHGRKIDGPWVLGPENGLEYHYFFLVQRRDKATLMAIILREVPADSVIYSDKWPAYLNLNR